MGNLKGTSKVTGWICVCCAVSWTHQVFYCSSSSAASFLLRHLQACQPKLFFSGVTRVLFTHCLVLCFLWFACVSLQALRTNRWIYKMSPEPPVVSRKWVERFFGWVWLRRWVASLEVWQRTTYWPSTLWFTACRRPVWLFADRRWGSLLGAINNVNVSQHRFIESHFRGKSATLDISSPNCQVVAMWSDCIMSVRSEPDSWNSLNSLIKICNFFSFFFLSCFCFCFWCCCCFVFIKGSAVSKCINKIAARLLLYASVLYASLRD